MSGGPIRWPAHLAVWLLAGHCALMTGDSQSLGSAGDLPVLAKPFRIEQLAALMARLATG